MRLNEKNVASFAVCSSPIDKEGYLSKKSEIGKGYQRRWFVLKGNLLFYFEKKQDKEPVGLIVLEACSVQASAQVQHAFEISFDGQGTRTYLLLADNDEDMQSWMKAISHASYEYLRTIVNELQRRVNLLTSSSANDDVAASDMSLLRVGPPKGAPSPRRVQSTKETSKRLVVQNGIVVDAPEVAPPIPPKMKSSTMAGGRNHSQDSGETSLDRRGVPTAHRDVQQMRTLPPHSSPVTTSSRVVNSQKPLSPVTTLDRTPVLQPTVVAPRDSSVPPDPSLISSAENGTTGPLRTPGAGVDQHSLIDEATSHPSPNTKRQLAAPPNPKKSIYEMHDEFTQAMAALRSERNEGSPSS